MGGTSKNITIDLDEDETNGIGTVATTDIVDEGVTGRSDIVDEDADPRDRLPERAVQNADGSVTLPLLYPQVIGRKKEGKTWEDKFDALTFHRLRGADQQRIASASDAKQVSVAFSCSTRLSQMVMDKLYEKLDLEDITDAGRVLNHFLTSGRTTGR
ncbi:hypothetical protein [Agrobacterium tumefaciens]|uniref:hypothetical protein n=1 Tax=Agrobacterium tumefaciens TaxID=358 RepID=UPI001572EAE6|nr:hypothetical protein [Agrobacterium tumefaciens]NTB04239.1 hypothetical protein [Agrobacterium tumefaciens]